MGVGRSPAPGADDPLPWSLAWERAAYGPGGFYTDGPGATEWPARFFRTSVHVGAVFCGAVARLLVEVDERLGSPARLDVLDVGAGRGELLHGVLDALPDEVAARARAVAIDVHAPPHDLDPRVGWIVGAAPDAVPGGIHGLIVANEWLDDIPLDVVELGADGVARLVLVGREGAEHLGPMIDDDIAWAAWDLDAARARSWLARSQPLEHPGDRAELGMPRDDAWRAVVDRLAAGTALAIDYQHVGGAGTLTGYDRGGRAAAPVPDGHVNITAHVCVDTVALAVGATVTRQREALRSLGVSGALPDRALASSDPSAYADALEAASDASELLDPVGLGDFRWIRVDR